MTKRDYTQEFKEQILRECQEVGNVAVVARRHNISPNTILLLITLFDRILLTIGGRQRQSIAPA
jgi:transposase-like protein